MADKKGLAPAPPEPADDRLNEVFARLRVDEQRSSELRKKMLFLEQNMLSNHRTAMDQVKQLQGDIVSVKHHIQEIEDRMLTIIKELRLTARKEDIEVMRKYLEMWDPVKFVTIDTVERMINDRLGVENPPLKPVAPPAEIVEEIVEEPEVSEESVEEDAGPEEESEKDGPEEGSEDVEAEQESEKSGPELQDSFEQLLEKHEKGNV